MGAKRTTNFWLNLQEVLTRVRSEYDTRILRRVRDITRPQERKLTTSYVELDELLGIGGLPRGHVIELSGAATSGVRTVALHILAAAQQRQEQVAYIDCGLSFDVTGAAAYGIDVERLTVVRPHNGNGALAIAHTLAAHGGVSVVIFDDVATVYAEEGGVQRLMLALRRLRPVLAQSRATVLFLNGPAGDGLLHHDAVVRLCLQRQRWLWWQGDVAGVQTRVTVARNKFGRTNVGTSLQLFFPPDEFV